MNSNKFVIYICFLGFLALGSTSSFAVCPDPITDCSLPGISPAGFPNFEQGANIKVKNNKEGEMKKLKAKYMKSSASTLLFSADDTLDITKTKLKLVAKVKKDGSVKGKIKIKGSIAELGINKKKLLMSAVLTGDWDVSEDGLLVGFDTMDIYCNPNLPISCTDAESVYVALADAIDSARHLKTTGTVVTTVPLPAAVWLFASGLLGLAGMARHRGKV